MAGLLNAAEAVVMSIAVTRFGRLSDAGILLLAFAMGNVLMTIGKFGGRMYQATDIKGQYAFRDYLAQRFCTLLFMLAVLGGYLFISHYEMYKMQAVALVTAIYMVEVIEDCLWGYWQLNGYLFVGAQMFVTRWLAIMVVFVAALVLGSSMVEALVWSFLAGGLVFLAWAVRFYCSEGCGKAAVPFPGKSFSDFSRPLKGLFRHTFPLFLAGFCSIFVANLPRFAIDRYLTDEIQACYGFVAMPVFVIGLLNQFIYQPTVVGLTREFYEGDMTEFRLAVRRQILAVGGLSLACICGAALVGIPVLSLIYHTDLSNYWRELVILQAAGTFLALSGYFTVLLTLMRKQRFILRGYLGALLAGVALLGPLVLYYGTVGASCGYLLVMMLLAGYYFVCCRSVMEKARAI